MAEERNRLKELNLVFAYLLTALLYTVLVVGLADYSKMAVGIGDHSACSAHVFGLKSVLAESLAI